MQFTGICLLTDDVPRLKDFYGKVFGCAITGDDVHADLDCFGVQLSIFSSRGMEELAPGSMGSAGTGSFTMGFLVDDIEVEYERIKGLGIELLKDLQTHPWGSRSFWFRDSDGNIISFHSPA